MTSTSKSKANSSKRARKMEILTNDEKDNGNKKIKKDISAILGDVSSLNKNRIYNYGYVKKPAELFRKDLISAMKMADCEQLAREDYILITDTWKEEWEKGVQVPVNPESLPEPSFRCIKKEDETITMDAKDRAKPIKKTSKPTETDIEVYGHYELDLLDLSWLHTLQESDESIKLSEKFVEDLIDELEHQCARNMKAKQVGIEYDDHVICDVCRSPDAEDGNEMVFCDSCNICVHQACYGITHIPDGEWLCRPCKELGYQKDLPCVLCPNPGGALKPTTTGEWAHVACALWIPEINIGCVKLMEPIAKVKQISPTRLNLVCSVCKEKRGAPIQCSVNTCKIAYHVTCAFKAKLKMKTIAIDDKKGVKLKSYCSKHSKQEVQKDNESLESSQNESNSDEEKQLDSEVFTETESEDSCNEFWKYIDITQINQMFLPVLLDEYSHTPKEVLLMYIDLVLQYWKLKRISNNGSPLIKMINTTSLERLKIQQHAGILRFRVDLERIRNLSYMLCRREKIKRNWVKTHQSTVEQAIVFATGSPLPISEDQEETSTNYIMASPNYKSNSSTEERMKLVKEIINTSIIYEEDWDEDKDKPKILVKQLKSLTKNDSIEKLRKHRPNPYLKFYPQRRSESNDGSQLQQSSNQIHQRGKNGKTSFNGSHNKNYNGQTKINGFPVSSSSLPLRSKSVPANKSSSPKSESIENTFRDKIVTKNDHQPSSPDSIKEEKIVNNSIITRASALIGYKIPKKKNHDNHKEDDHITRGDSNYPVSPLKNTHNEQRVTESNNHHFLRRPPMEDSFKEPVVILHRLQDNAIAIYSKRNCYATRSADKKSSFNSFKSNLLKSR